MSEIEIMINKMTPDKWYPVKHPELLKPYFWKLENIELTFNEDYTQVKKTLWHENKPLTEAKKVYIGKYVNSSKRNTRK